jgi:hypothetical protein
VTALAAEAPSTTGTFTGYLAAFGRDHGNDTITGPAAVADSVAAVNRGDIIWHLTDSHSEFATDVVATVQHASVDDHGVLVTARWAPTERAQQLRQMVQAGHHLGLSIDYLTDASRPDGQGGRYLDSIRIVGGAVTPHPMNSAALIRESKTGTVAWAPVVSWGADAQARAERNDPQRLAEDKMLAACDWPPRHWDRETRLALIRGVAEARAKAIAATPDEAEARRKARWERDNEYCYGLAATMARLRAG